MATIDVKDAAGSTVAIEKPLIPGRSAAATSRPIVLATEDKAALDALATQTTAAAILAKLIAAPATEAKQDTQITALGAVATETTLASVLAKIIAAPATEAKQDTALTTLASILSKIIAAPATEAKQDTQITALGTLATQTTLAAVLAKLSADPATQSTLALVAAQLSTMLGYVDGLEGLIGTTNTALAAVAHDAADSGAPRKIGAKAVAGVSGVTLVAAADRTDLYAGLDGVVITRPHCGLEDIVSGTASNTDGTSTQVIAAAGAGVKQYLTRVSLSNSHASSSVMVALKSGTTSRYRVNVPPGGRELSFDPPLPPNAANEAWNFDPDSAVTTIECSLVGFKSKV
jgi:hypothetical protein